MYNEDKVHYVLANLINILTCYFDGVHVALDLLTMSSILLKLDRVCERVCACVSK